MLGGGTPTPSTNSSCFVANSSTITGYTCNDTSVVVPNSINNNIITTIAANAFKAKNITSISIPSSITTIDQDAFSDNQITSLVIRSKDSSSYSLQAKQVTQSNLSTIGKTSFANNKLQEITIPPNVSTIGEGAFKNNTLNKIVILSSTPPVIGTDAFGSQQNNLIIEVPPGSASTYQNSATWSNYRNSITDGVTPPPVDDSCFTTAQSVSSKTASILGYSCAETDVDIPDAINGYTIDSISPSAFEGRRLTSVRLPINLKYISSNAFSGNYLTSINIPSKVTYLGDYAFSYNKLTSITIPNSVTYLGDYAFSSNQLTSVTIPSGVTGIGYGAFDDNQLSVVNIISSTPAQLGGDAFGYDGNRNPQLFINVPNGTANIYKLATGWSKYSSNIHENI